MHDWRRLPWYEQITYLEGMLRERIEKLSSMGVEKIEDDSVVKALASRLPAEGGGAAASPSGDELSELQGFGLNVRTVKA